MARKDYKETLRKNLENYHKLKVEKPFTHKCLYKKSAAKQKGVLFDVTPEYLESIWSGTCAISGIPIELYNKREQENHAELDRIDPELGYIEGNVQWCSRKFNRLKGNATLDELLTIIKWYKSLDALKKEYG